MKKKNGFVGRRKSLETQRENCKRSRTEQIEMAVGDVIRQKREN